MLPHFLSPCQISKQEGVRHVGKVRLEGLEVGIEDNMLIDHLLVQAGVCEEACHRRVSGIGVSICVSRDNPV